MLKKIISYSIALLVFITACAQTNTNDVKQFSPTEQQKLTYQTALQFVSAYHYAKPQFNDAFSQKALKNYIETLDPAKSYFMQEDIDRFKQYENQLDDGIFTGDVTPAFDIFNIYMKRQHDRIEYALSLLSLAPDFSANDSFEVDREKSSYCSSAAAYDKLWRQKVTYELLITKRGKTDTAQKYIQDVRKRYLDLQKFAAKTKGDDVFQLYMNAILETTDPHTNYYTPKSAEDFNQSMSLSLEGIGAVLQMESEYTKIREIVKGGPADKSKQLFAGDKIIAVAQGKDSDMVSVVDWRIDDVVGLIRGKKGTAVRLKVIPASDQNAIKLIDLVRDKIVLEDQSAKSTVKEIKRNGKKLKVGVITLPTFYIDFAAASRGDANYKSTTRDVKKLIEGLKNQNVNGIIIDLRNNGGGSLQEAIELTGLFIKNGPVVQVKNADGSIRVEQDRDDNIFYDGPLAVLVNRFSASASEIFSAAIQDYNRGIIVGERTFGKGTVQNMVNLNDFINYNDKKLGEVKLTIAKFYRITGGSTQHKGVTPDIELPGVFAADKFGEDASPYALPWDQINMVNFSSTDIVKAKRAAMLKEHNQRMKTSPEYKYLLEDIQSMNAQEAKRYYTLNETLYKAELTKEETLKKEREQARKKDRKDQKDQPDLILEEAEQVIADWGK